MYMAIVTRFAELRDAVKGNTGKVILVDANGVHMGEFTIPGDKLPKLITLVSAAQRWTRYFVCRTNNYYDEVTPTAIAEPKSPKV